MRSSGPLPPLFAEIPAELKSRSRWLCWRYGDQPRPNGKYPKIPCNRHGIACDYTEPAEWMPFELAVQVHLQGAFDGVGIVLGDGLCGLDEDDCFVNGGIEAAAAMHIFRLRSYAEESVSGTGIHGLAFGSLPGERRRTGKHELYCDRRFFVVTGRRLPDSPRSVEYRDAELADVYRMIFGTPDATQFAPITQRGGENTASLETNCVPKFSDTKVVAAILQNAVAKRYWLGYPPGMNQSRADFALMCKLAFYTWRNVEQMLRLFRRSGLYGREKHRARRRGLDYLTLTAISACRVQVAVWYPRYRAKRSTRGVGRPKSDNTLHVFELRRQHPEFTPADIAVLLHLKPQTVRTALRRHRRNGCTSGRRAG
jgi:primase-polymerase (primpol)-like protein